MVNIYLNFQLQYSRLHAILRAVFYPLIIIPLILYLIGLVFCFYFLSFVCLIQTVVTQQFPSYGLVFTKGMAQYFLRIQMYLLGLDDYFPSFGFGFYKSDLVHIEVIKQQEYSRVLALIYAFCGWMLVIPQLIWFGVFTVFIIILSFINFWYLMCSGKHLIEFQNQYIKYLQLTCRLFVFFVGLRQEYPIFDYSEMVLKDEV